MAAGFFQRVRGAVRGALAGARLGARGTRGYEAVGGGRRAMAMRANVSNSGPNAELLWSAEGLRQLSYEALRNNGVARSIVDTIVSGTVGSGIRPLPTCSDPATKKALKKLWDDWQKLSDATGNASFYGQQALAVAAMVAGGETFGILRPIDPDDDLGGSPRPPVPLHVQLVEADQCPVRWSRVEESGNLTIAGIECDPKGRRVAYHLWRRHPQDSVLLGVTHPVELEPVRFPASSILHLHSAPPGRLNSLRGEPWMTPILAKLWDLDGYDDAELMRKRLAASLSGFITSPKVEDMFPLDENGNPVDPKKQAQGVQEIEFEPGTLTPMRPGESITLAQPAEVGGSYEPFMRRQLQHIARAIGIPYHELTGDLTGLQDRVIQAILVEYRRRVEMWQELLLIQQFCEPVWRKFCELAWVSGAIEIPAGLSFDDFSACRWISPQWEFIRPVQEVQAYTQAVQAGVISRTEVISRYGWDAEAIDEEIAADREREKRLGLRFTTSVPDPAPVAAPAAPDPAPSQAASDPNADQAAPSMTASQ